MYYFFMLRNTINLYEVEAQHIYSIIKRDAAGCSEMKTTRAFEDIYTTRFTGPVPENSRQ